MSHGEEMFNQLCLYISPKYLTGTDRTDSNLGCKREKKNQYSSDIIFPKTSEYK